MNRLKSYIEKLVLLPRRENQPKKGNNGVLSDSTTTGELVQTTERLVLPLPKRTLRTKPSTVTPEMNAFRAHHQLRQERMNKKWAGKRAHRENKESKK